MNTICLLKYSLQVGGAEKQFVMLANGLASKGKKVYIITNSFNDSLLDKLNKKVKIFFFPQKIKLLQLFFLISIIRKYNIEVLHTWDYLTSFFGFFVKFFAHVKLIDGSIRSAPTEFVLKNNKKFKFQFYKLMVFKIFNIAIVSNSKAGLKSFHLSKYKNAHVIYNGYSEIEKKNNTPPFFNLSIGMLANMRWKKDFKTFILAGIELLEEGQTLDIYLIGDGQNKKGYEDLIPEKFKQHFIFTGFISNSLEIISKLDICVLCNEISGEGLSNSIMEYMYCGKPIIATDMGGNDELVEHNINGFLIPEKDVQSLKHHLNLLIESDSMRNSMGKESKMKLANICNHEKMIQSYLDLYNQ